MLCVSPVFTAAVTVADAAFPEAVPDAVVFATADVFVATADVFVAVAVFAIAADVFTVAVVFVTPADVFAPVWAFVSVVFVPVSPEGFVACILRRAAATDAKTSGHPAVLNGRPPETFIPCV